MWTDYLHNAQTLRGVFGTNIPQLRGVELVQLVESGCIDLVINLDSLPEPTPKRWKAKGFDRLLVKLTLFNSTHVIRRRGPLGPVKVSVDWEGERLHVRSDDGMFELRGSCNEAIIDFRPYRAMPQEVAPKWYAPPKSYLPEIWIDHSKNDQAAREAFGGSLPEMRGLSLEQIVLDPAGELALTFCSGGLPSQYPSKWNDQGVNNLQLWICCSIADLAIRRTGPLRMDNTAVELRDRRLHVTSDDGAFELTAGFDAAKTYFHPIKESFLHEPMYPAWYNSFGA